MTMAAGLSSHAHMFLAIITDNLLEPSLHAATQYTSSLRQSSATLTG